MNSNEIESNVKRIFENFSKEEFPFDFLLAYGISKTSITPLMKGDVNLSKTNGEILYKKHIFLKEEATGSLLSTIDSISKEERVLKYKPKFAILTDYEILVAKDLKLGKNFTPVGMQPGFVPVVPTTEVSQSRKCVRNPSRACRRIIYPGFI